MLGSAESAAADFSQAPLMVSYSSLLMISYSPPDELLIRVHVDAK
jgi:hypothetical protein